SVRAGANPGHRPGAPPSSSQAARRARAPGGAARSLARAARRAPAATCARARTARTQAAPSPPRRPAPRATIARSPCVRATTGRAETRARPLQALPRQSRMRSRDRILVERLAGAISEYSREDDHADQQQHGRCAPQRPGARLERRTIDHELTVARHEIVDDLLVRIAFGHLLMDLATEIRGDQGIRIRDARVEALRAAYLTQQASIALVHRRIVETELALDRESE